MIIHHLVIKLLRYLGTSDNEISECYKSRLYKSIKRIRKIKKLFKLNNLENTTEYAHWKNKLLEELKN